MLGATTCDEDDGDCAVDAAMGAVDAGTAVVAGADPEGLDCCAGVAATGAGVAGAGAVGGTAAGPPGIASSAELLIGSSTAAGAGCCGGRPRGAP